MDTYTPSI